MTNPKLIVLDTETTGLEPPIGVVEIGWAELNEDLDIVSEFSTLVDPELPINCAAAGVHGVYEEDFEELDYPTLDDLIFPDGEVILICHNVPFDRPLVEHKMNIVGEICTLLLSRRLLPDAPDHKLATLSCYCGLPRQLAHRVEGDVRNVWGLLGYLCEGCEYTIWDMFSYYNRPQVLKRMPWGKHKGLDMKDVPKSYLHWMSGLEDLDKDVRATVDYWRSRR